MSITAMNWAWDQQLTPRVKCVLVALAFNADDHGVCWPSVQTVARKCGVSSRTVQRTIQELIAGGLLQAHVRFRADGSSTSNRYVLMINGGDKVSATQATNEDTSTLKCHAAPDNPVTPRTTNEPTKKPPLPPTANPTVAATESQHTGSGRGVLQPLVYPKGLSESEQAAAREKLAAFPGDLAQQLLDELAGRMEAGTIRVSSLAYLRGLVSRASAGNFTPEAALPIAERRKRQQQLEATLRQTEAAHSDVLKADAQVLTPASDNPLVRKLEAIRRRSRCGSGDAK